MSKYVAYLLRIWMGGGPEQSGWRASLEDPHTREIQLFDSLESLYHHLQGVATPPQADDLPPDEGRGHLPKPLPPR